VTFSNGADRDLMADVAAVARGQHYHADDAATLRDVFRELAAQTAKLTQ
jgi:hypothetical protein